MRVLTVLTAGLAYGTVVEGLKILMNNDDGFGSGNLRELYKLLKGAGHEGRSRLLAIFHPSPSQLYLCA